MKTQALARLKLTAANSVAANKFEKEVDKIQEHLNSVRKLLNSTSFRKEVDRIDEDFVKKLKDVAGKYSKLVSEVSEVISSFEDFEEAISD